MPPQGVRMASNRISLIKAKDMKSTSLLRGENLSISRGYYYEKAFEDRLITMKHLAAISIFIVLAGASLFPYAWNVDADELSEPTITSETQGKSTATWAFEDKANYTTSETVINDNEVILQLNTYKWDQTKKQDFNRGTGDNVTIFQTSETKPVWSDDFEDGEGAWEHGIIEGGPDQWEHGTPTGESSFIGTHSGSNVTGINLSGKYDDDDDGEPDDIYLMSPPIVLSQAENTWLSFWHYYITEEEKDGGVVEFSIDNGVSWRSPAPEIGVRKKINSSENPLDGRYSFTGNSSGWQKVEFDISSYDGSPTFLMMFRFATNGQVSDWGWYIDDIEIISTIYSDGQVELAPRPIQMGNPPINNEQRPTNVTVVDINNPVEFDGILTKWSVHPVTSGMGKMKIFREEGDKFVLMNETSLVNLESGEENIFDCYFWVKAGDYIGWYGETADIWADGSGQAYLMDGDVVDDQLKLNYTYKALIFSIRAWGTTRYSTGTFTSMVFDTGSEAEWDNISWSENPQSPQDITNIVLQTRTGNSNDTTHESWSTWSSQLTNESGSLIEGPNTRYIQFKATLTSTDWTFTPTLYEVSVSYRKYSSYGEIETQDFVPDFIVQWLEFSASEQTNGQVIEYNYSLDSGINWQPVPPNKNLSSVSVLGRKIRFKTSLITDDTTVSPKVGRMSINYSTAEANMIMFIETNKKTAEPGDRITYNIFYRNIGIGDAKDVTITLFLDENLTFRDHNSEVKPTSDPERNSVTWQFDTVKPGPGNIMFFMDTEVRDVGEGATISTYAVLNYSDIGENPYSDIISDTIEMEVTISQDLLPYYLLLGLIIAIIIVLSALLVWRRAKAIAESGINIKAEDLERGIGYLVMEENPAVSYKLFSNLIDKGHKGFCITRTFPGRVKTKYVFDDVSVLWLSRARDSDSILPTNLGGIAQNVKDFMGRNNDGVVLFDGLEYLMVHNDFPKVLKLVHAINEHAAINDTRLLIPLNPYALEKDKLAFLKRDLNVLG